MTELKKERQVCPGCGREFSVNRRTGMLRKHPNEYGESECTQLARPRAARARAAEPAPTSAAVSMPSSPELTVAQVQALHWIGSTGLARKVLRPNEKSIVALVRRGLVVPNYSSKSQARLTAKGRRLALATPPAPGTPDALAEHWRAAQVFQPESPAAAPNGNGAVLSKRELMKAIRQYGDAERTGAQTAADRNWSKINDALAVLYSAVVSE